VSVTNRSAFLLLLGVGVLLAIFASQTVQRRTDAELQSDYGARASRSLIEYWLTHGYFDSAGLLIFTAPNEPAVVYRNSTGGELVTAFVLEKIHGGFSARLLAWHNLVVLMLASTLLAFLGFRLSRSFDTPPLHALALAAALEAIYFTFPDNLATYWHMSAWIFWLAFVCAFFALEQDSTVAQAIAIFIAAYMEFVAGVFFALAYVAVTLLLDGPRSLRRTLLTVVAPTCAALALFGAQLVCIRAHHPELPRKGSGFAYRSGLDGGSRDVYRDQRDIAFGRDTVRAGFRRAGFANVAQLFRWPWLFAYGAAAFVAVLIAAARGKIPRHALTVLLSLLGCYILYAAVFSQAVMLHPYFFDMLLFTPLVLALFVIAPSALEASTTQRGIVVIAVLLLAVSSSMLQLRRYALQYPSAPSHSEYNPPRHGLLPSAEGRLRRAA
jgi:hypothetical protein